MENILIVEDSVSVSNALKVIIDEDMGYNGVVAHSKKEASEMLLKYRGKFAVALLDLGLPDAPNGEVVDFVVKFNIPSIILTGSTLKDDEKTFRDKHIVDYVIKESSFAIYYTLSLVKRIVSNRKKKVLIVDDSKVFLEQAKMLLDRYQLKVFGAADGIEALKIIKKHPDIKVVFTDYNMPNMDGLELTKNLRKKYRKDEMSIIIMTAMNSDTKKISAKFLKYGANDYIYKGFSNEEFYARLNSALEILELFEQAKDKANKDYMTGMFNRRYLFDEGQELYTRIKVREDDSLVTAIIDIDNFKNINDTWGHDIGDIAIKEVAVILSRVAGDNSLIARLGGEEFCLLLKGRTKKEAKKLLEQIREAFEKNIIKTKKCDVGYTVSIGATFDMGLSLEDMISKADKALYCAKNRGRNLVSYYED